MSGFLAELGAKARGNEICRVLTLRGYEVAWYKTEADGHRIVLCVWLIPRFWRRGFVLDANDNPNTAEAAIKAFKAEKLGELDRGEPCELLRVLIAERGETAVRKALA